jgi:hypothetical protein
VDERVDVRPKGHDERRRDPGKDEDSIRIHKAVAQVRELAREEPVAREQSAEARKALIRRVRRQYEDGERERLYEVVDCRARRAGRKHPARDLREDRVCRARAGMHLDRQIGDAEEERDRNAGHDEERRAGIASLRVPKGGDAVRDRFDSG